MEFGEFLKKKRKEKGMSIRQVAIYANCSSSYLSLLERGLVGQKGPTPAFLRKLAKPLGVSFEALMSAAGHTVLVEEEPFCSGALVMMLRSSLGDEVEDFARRLKMNVADIKVLEETGVSYETFEWMLNQLFSHQRSLAPRQKDLVQRLEALLYKLPYQKSTTVELLFHALMEIIEGKE